MANDPEIGCGISWLYITKEEDPFFPCCVVHDQYYEQHKLGILCPDFSRYQVDQLFLHCMKSKAGNSKKLKAKAYLYYSLARSFGWIFWN